MRQGQCPRCGEHCRLTRHHIYPKRWFQKRRKLWREYNLHTVLLCRECHDDIERIILDEELAESDNGIRVELTLSVYDLIVAQFCNSPT